MVTPTGPRKAEAGVQGGLDWLEMKIIECIVKPMDEDNARNLAVYDAAYRALKRRGGENTAEAESHSRASYNAAEGHISMKDAEQWCDGMINADSTTGPHWTLDKTKQIQAQRKIGGSPITFYAALNATYSDLCEFFKKYGISNMDAYVDFVKAFWLNDEDAVGDKTRAYYEAVVKGQSTV